jgi:hypothetical protein
VGRGQEKEGQSRARLGPQPRLVNKKHLGRGRMGGMIGEGEGVGERSETEH